MRLLRFIFRIAALAIALNEIRGLVLAGPVLFAMWQSGGTIMALWLGFCSLAGIALSVIVPTFALRKIEQHVEKRRTQTT